MDNNPHPPTAENKPGAPPAYGMQLGGLPPGGNMPPALPKEPLPPPRPRAPRPRTARWRGQGAFSLAIIAFSLALMLLVGAVLAALLGLQGALGNLFNVTLYNNTPPAGSFSVINVAGTIQSASPDAMGIHNPSYNHSATLAHIKQLAEDDGNKGILLNMNTGGGGVYESDEAYLALMDYKEKTGRPVWAYMGPTCASGGYYIAAAADYIIANRNTTTGSIGVYISMTDTSGLYEKLGMESVLIRSGDNKGAGIEGAPITDGQRAVYQSVVDESYEQFVGIIAEGRGMPLDEVRALADGRVYTGRQALDLGLVDALGNWDSALEAFIAETGGTAFYPNFSRTSAIGQLLGGFAASWPQGDAEAVLDWAEAFPDGVPMAMYLP